MKWRLSLRMPAVSAPAKTGLCIVAVFFITRVYADDSLVYNDWAALSTLKTIRLFPAGAPNQSPVLKLGSSEQLLLTFDELDSKPRSLKYTLLHCTPDWTQTGLTPPDFPGTPAVANVSNVSQSFNTSRPYLHYCIPVPGPLNIRYSGNYIVIVYEDSITSPLLTARMMVTEENVTVEGLVQPATDVEQKKYRQQVDFTVAHPGIDIISPFETIQVCVFQNHRKDNAICGLKPLYVKDQLLDFNYEYETSFEGGNEFRRLDILPPTQGIGVIRRLGETLHLYAEQDKPRSSLVYAEAADVNGAYALEEKDSLSTDYVAVNLALADKNPLPDGQLYVAGDFCRWNLDSSNAMHYDTIAKAWQAELLMKQGEYDYCYLWLGEGLVNGEVGVVEGSHSATENDYMICVYYREPGGRYDRLLAASRLSSRPGK